MALKAKNRTNVAINKNFVIRVSENQVKKTRLTSAALYCQPIYKVDSAGSSRLLLVAGRIN